MDYIARQNNTTYGRFTSIDPLAEKYHSWSPYAYVMNNPMKFIDPDGRQVWLGNANQMRGEVYRQQYPPQVSSWQGAVNSTGRDIKNLAKKIQPSSISLTAEVAAGVGVEKTTKIGGTLVTSGNDAGSLAYTETESTGLNTVPEVSTTFGIDVMFAERKDNFSIDDLEGHSDEVIYTAKLKVVDISVSVTTMTSPRAGKVNTYSLTIGKGVGLKGLFKFTGITIQKNNTQIKATTENENENK